MNRRQHIPIPTPPTNGRLPPTLTLTVQLPAEVLRALAVEVAAEVLRRMELPRPAQLPAVPAAPPADPDALLTKEQTAERLGMCQRQVSNFAASGELPFVKLGRAIRFRAEDVQAFVEARRVSRRSGRRQSTGD
jgi:excisionase family DNA binding protein